MALVTGNYVTASGAPLPAGAVPQVEAVPSKNAVTVNGRIISVEPQRVTPDGTTGAFSFDLIPTVDVIDRDFHYIVRGFYLKGDGYATGSGFTRVDIFDFNVYVPTAGGTIGELASSPVPFDTWVIVDPLLSDTNPPPVQLAGALYLSADMTDPTLGTGDLYKVV